MGHEVPRVKARVPDWWYKRDAKEALASPCRALSPVTRCALQDLSDYQFLHGPIQRDLLPGFLRLSQTELDHVMKEARLFYEWREDYFVVLEMEKLKEARLAEMGRRKNGSKAGCEAAAAARKKKRQEAAS